MIKQPWGCFLVLVTAVLSVSGCALTGFLLSLLFGYSEPDVGAAFGGFIGLPMFFPALDFAHKLEIRWFCRKHDLRIVRIKTFRNHFGVDYIEDGKKKYNRWPAEFERFIESPG